MHGMVPVARGSRGSEPVGVATKWKDRDVRRVEARARRARTALRVAASLLLACAAGFAARPSRAQETPAKDVTAFVAVNVVPMDRERVLRDRTVLVEDGRIVAIGRKVAVPKGARIVDGAGRAFLSPGLADMHMHADTAEALKVYLANGVTSVLNMGGASPEFVAQLRPAVNAGKRPGPHVYVAFIVDGSPRYGHFFVTTPEEARWAVRLAKTNGYDFIKVYNDLSPACFQALVDEGRAQHLPVVGHGVRSVGLERQLDAGQLMVAHAEEFLYTVFKTAPDAPPGSAPDPAQIPGAIAFVLRDRAFVTADLNTYATIARQWGRPDVVDAILHGPELRYVGPANRIYWKHSDYQKRSGSLDATTAFLARFVKAMSDAGVPLITGTDAPTIPGLAPGYSLHDDLDALQRAGLTRYQALAAATRTPGEMMHRAQPDAAPFGTVAVGSRADLVLSAGNPLEDLATLRQPLGVMANGRWYARADLQALLDDVATTYAAAAPR